jgi:hypothetical protein
MLVVVWRGMYLPGTDRWVNKEEEDDEDDEN